MEKFVANIKENIYGYARVSSQHQKEDRQIEDLKKYGIEEENIFVEYQLLKKIIKRTQNNVLVIKSIDRLGRNYKQIQEEWREITQDLKTDIVVLDMPILDTRQYKDLLGSFISDLVLQVLSFVAEEERNKIRSRQKEGIEIAKMKGKKFGRPKVEIPQNFEEEYKKWKNGEQTAKATMEKLELKRGKFYAFVRENEGRIK